MIVMLVWRHFIATIKKTYYRIVYRSRLFIGKNTTFRKSFSIVIGKEGKIVIGKNCFFNNYCSITSMGSVRIGEGTIFGESVKIYDHNHRFSDSAHPIKEQGYSIGKVNIGKHCWIGSNAVILKNTVIEDNCVIGAGVIVSGRIKANSIVKLNNNYSYEVIQVKNG